LSLAIPTAFLDSAPVLGFLDDEVGLRAAQGTAAFTDSFVLGAALEVFS
jgi:hypothetical protein